VKKSLQYSKLLNNIFYAKGKQARLRTAKVQWDYEGVGGEYEGSTRGVRRKYEGSTREVRGSTRGVRASTREYEGVQREYKGVRKYGSLTFFLLILCTNFVF
jgi:hypothetical protein